MKKNQWQEGQWKYFKINSWTDLWCPTSHMEQKQPSLNDPHVLQTHWRLCFFIKGMYSIFIYIYKFTMFRTKKFYLQTNKGSKMSRGMCFAFCCCSFIVQSQTGVMMVTKVTIITILCSAVSQDWLEKLAQPLAEQLLYMYFNIQYLAFWLGFGHYCFGKKNKKQNHITRSSMSQSHVLLQFTPYRQSMFVRFY